jgi:hypothetical protein
VTDLQFSDSIHVPLDAAQTYALVADVTRMGEWSPICKECWWDDDAEVGRVGAWFTGRNVSPERTWEARCEVVTADRGREFSWEVNRGWARWGFRIEAADGGALLTQEWAFLPKGIASFNKRFGSDAEAEIAKRSEAAKAGIPSTLAAIRRTAEGG